MPQKGLRIKNLKFFTGVENFEENNSVPFDKFYQASNIRFDGKTVTSAPGYQKFGNTLTGGTRFHGKFEYAYFDGVNITRKLIGFYNKSFYEFNKVTQTWDIISTTWPNIEDNDIDGKVYGNSLYVVGRTGGTGNGVGKVFSGYNYTFTVSGVVTTPAINDVYQIAGQQYIILSTSITAGSGTIVAKKLLNLSEPTGTGNLQKVKGSQFNNTTFTAGVDFTIPAGAAGAKVIINLPRFPILTTTGGDTGYFGGRSLEFGGALATTLTTEVAFVVSSSGDGDVTELTNGQYMVDYLTGIVYGKRADAGVDGTAIYNIGADASIAYSAVAKSANVETDFVVIPNSPEGIGLESFVERLFVIGDPSFVGQVISSQPATSANEYYKVENFTVGLGASYYTAAKESPLIGVRVLNNVLYYSGNNSVYQHTQEDIAAGLNPRELSRTGGAISQKAFTVVENDIWFLAPDNTLRSLGNEKQLGENPRTKAVSEVIKRSMKYLDSVQPNPIITYHNRLIKVRVRTKGSPTNNFTIIFDYNTGGFSFDLGRAVAVSCIWENQLVYGEDSSGSCFYDDAGYTANGAAIPIRADTPFIDDNRPDLYKRARYIVFSGQQSYTQRVTLRLYRDGDYNTYTTYTIPSPQERGIPYSSFVVDGGTFGDSLFGDTVFAGNDLGSGSDLKTYLTRGYKISVSQKSNMFALGIDTAVNGGKIVCEQLTLMVIDETQDYKRSNI